MTEAFCYAGPYLTLERAEMALEDCYATGEIVEGERPNITSRKLRDGRRYFITLTYVS